MALAAATLFSAPAFAASARQSGSTYSSANTWYVSTNYRTITSSQGGNVILTIYTYPKLSGGGDDQLKWRLIGNDGGIWDNHTSYIVPPGSYLETLTVTPKPVGWQFRNSFARYTTCNNCNHNFTGFEYY